MGDNMFLPNRKEYLFHYAGRVWLTRTIQNLDMQKICICINTNDTFVSVGAIDLDRNGVYHSKGMALGTLHDDSFRSYIESVTGPLSDSFQTNSIFSDVVKSYKETNSIKATAAALEISEEKARRILITEGVYTCEFYEEIKKLLETGKSIEDIAFILHATERKIRRYLPYS